MVTDRQTDKQTDRQDKYRNPPAHARRGLMRGSVSRQPPHASKLTGARSVGVNTPACIAPAEPKGQHPLKVPDQPSPPDGTPFTNAASQPSLLTLPPVSGNRYRWNFRYM